MVSSLPPAYTLRARDWTPLLHSIYGSDVHVHCMCIAMLILKPEGYVHVVSLTSNLHSPS